jgi:hypothetical protein
VRILGAFYLRLTGTDVDVYRYLEPLYNDYRKLRRKLPEGRKMLNIPLESAMITFSLILSAYICYYFHEYTNLPVPCLTSNCIRLLFDTCG